MKKHEIDLMYLLLRLRFEAYDENKDLFQALICIVNYYEVYFTKKYKGSKLIILGEEEREITLDEIRGDRVLGNNSGLLRPNAQMYYYVTDDNGKPTMYHFSWITFK